MDLNDRRFELDPKLAHPGNPHYDRYRAALKWVETGTVAMVVGFAAYGLGVKNGFAIVMAGAPVEVIGSYVVGREKLHLTDQRSDLDR